MAVRAKVKEVTRNVKGTSKLGKEYTYTKFVYTTDTGEEKTKQLFKDEVVNGINVGDTVDISFKKNDKGYFDLVSVDKAGAVDEAKQAPTYNKSTAVHTDKDVEIEVMNALNVASNTVTSGDINVVLSVAKQVLAAKNNLVAYAKDVRTKSTTEVSDDPFDGIS